MADSVAQVVRALIERDPTAYMTAPRDGRGHVLSVVWHPDFTLGMENLDLRRAFATMPTHERRVWLAMEIGWFLDVEIREGVPHPVERYGDPMTVEACAEYYGFALSTVQTYHQRANRRLSSALSIPRSRARPPEIALQASGNKKRAGG